MADKQNDIRIMGYALAFLYTVSIFICVNFSGLVYEHGYILLMVALFVFTLAAAIAVIKLEEWGRKLLVGLNAIFLVIFIGALVKNKISLQSAVGFLSISFITIVYFTQERIKAVFTRKSLPTRKSILIVDDDPGLVKTIKPRLLSSGYSVLTASTGERGLQVARHQNPDLIILDVILPGVKGRDVCKKLKDDPKTSTIPIIFLTAKDSPDDVEAEIAVGAISHITKPFDVTKLLNEIRNVIGT